MPLSLLTARQRDVFNFIRDKITNRGYGPTVREIGDHFRISSPNGVMCHLKALEKKGLITREPNMSRAIQLTDAVKQERGMPLVGLVAAGNLSEALLRRPGVEGLGRQQPEAGPEHRADPRHMQVHEDGAAPRHEG